MMLDELLRKTETDRATAQMKITRIRQAVVVDKRDLTIEETAEVHSALAQRDQLDARLVGLREMVADEARLTALSNEFHPTHVKERGMIGGARVTHETQTYNPGTDRDGSKFLQDVALDVLGNWGAHERLVQHQREEAIERGDMLTRSTSATAPGLVVPQYLVDLYAESARAGRHFADACTSHDLPAEGMQVYIPRQTGLSTTGLQATENTAVTETDWTDELISIPVRTNAGSASLSRQVIERSLGAEQFILGDLLRAYNNGLDGLLLNSAVWGLDAVATTATWTEAAPTGPKLYSQIQQAAGAIEGVLLDVDTAGVVSVMHGRRWRWLEGAQTSSWPFIAHPGQVGVSTGTASGEYPAGIRGYLPDGGPVVTSNNVAAAGGVGTNQDTVYVAAKQELHLFEDSSAPMFIRAEQPGAKQLRIDLVIFGYFAACFDRRAGLHRKIVGTGLVTPVYS